MSIEGDNPPCTQKICGGTGHEGQRGSDAPRHIHATGPDACGWRGDGMDVNGEEEAAACMRMARRRQRHACEEIACLRVDERCERHVVEQIGKDLPHVGVAVLSQALVVKPVPVRTAQHVKAAART